MLEQSVLIQNKLGLHARSASLFVKTASAYSASVEVSNQHAKANGKSIMSMLLLQATMGSEITLVISGTDESAAMDSLVTLIRNKFGEE